MLTVNDVNEFFLHPSDYPAYNLHPFFLSDRDKLFSDKRSG